MPVSGESSKPPRRKKRLNSHQRQTVAMSGRLRRKRPPRASGKMAEPFRSFDWASTDLGPVSKWSEPVRRAVAICASIASTLNEALITTGRAQRGRIAEFDRQSDALRSPIPRRNATLDTAPPWLEVLDNVPWMIWTVAPDGRCEFINRFYLKATGLSADDCIAPPEVWKKSPRDLPPFLSGVQPDHRDRAANLFWDSLESGRGWAYEVPIRHADGAYH